MNRISCHDIYSGQNRELQVRDNERHTRFLLVWGAPDGSAGFPAANISFRTIRKAMAAGVELFGILPVRVACRLVQREQDGEPTVAVHRNLGPL
ncbi:hypothetical protein [Paraburkholderia sediminicola]|uniref:hypothetical protein n=1 Tax=Paraburkholderia sediminicola TaxID=458836 RepID=UPI000FF17CBF